MCRQTRLRPQSTESAAHTGEGEKGESNREDTRRWSCAWVTQSAAREYGLRWQIDIPPRFIRKVEL